MKRMLFLFDYGRYLAKIRSGNTEEMMKVGVKKSLKKKNENDMYYNGAYYSISESCGNIDPLSNDRMFISTLYAIAKMAAGARKTGKVEVLVTLVVTIIQDLFSSQRKQYADYYARLKKMTTVTIGDVEVTIKMDDFIALPQGYIAFKPIKKLKKYADHNKLAVIYFGSTTTEITRLEKDDSGDLQVAFKRSIDKGYDELVDQCTSSLKIENPSGKYTANDISAIIKSRKADTDIEKSVSYDVGDYIYEMLERFNKCGIDTDMPVVIGGGPTLSMEEYWREELNVIDCLGIYGNVDGMHFTVKAMKKEKGIVYDEGESSSSELVS